MKVAFQIYRDLDGNYLKNRTKVFENNQVAFQGSIYSDLDVKICAFCYWNIFYSVKPVFCIASFLFDSKSQSNPLWPARKVSCFDLDKLW